MILFILALVLIGYATAFPAWYFVRKRVQWYRWDYGVPIYGISTWLLLTMTGVGATVSMTNFIVEIFWIVVMTVVSPWLRVIWPGSNDQLSKASSVACMAFPVVVAVLLRSAMPTL